DVLAVGVAGGDVRREDRLELVPLRERHAPDVGVLDAPDRLEIDQAPQLGLAHRLLPSATPPSVVASGRARRPRSARRRSPLQQVVVSGPNDVRVVEAPDPTPGPDDVVVKVSACGVCGSDAHYVAMGGLPIPGGGPMPLGHEISGVVAAVGSAV